MAKTRGRKSGKKNGRKGRKTIEQRVSALEKAIAPPKAARGRKSPRIAIISTGSKTITPPHVLRQLGL